MSNSYKKIKISYVMNVLNGEPFIKYQLKSIYKFAYEIIIVEGAYKKFRHAAKKFRSTDKTIKIIKNFYDPKNKIKLITKNEYYEDRLEMCNEFMRFVSGDVIWQIDVDEFYNDKTHKIVNEFFSKDKQLDQISFKFYNYYKTLDWVINGYNESLTDVIRVNRVVKGMRWSNQRPPTLVLKKKKIIPRKKINGTKMMNDGHIMHNLTMLFDKQVKNKFIYYSKKSRAVFSGNDKWYHDSWKNYEEKFSVSGFKNSVTYLTKRKHKIPKILENFSSDIQKNIFKNFKFENDNNIKKTISKKFYKKSIKLANQINSLRNRFIILRLFLSIILLYKIIIIAPKRDKKIMFMVLLINSIPNSVKSFIKFFR